MKNLGNLFLVGLILFPFLSTGCLKTRSDLKEDDKIEEKVKTNTASVDEIRNEITMMNGRISDIERNQAQSPGGPDPVTEETIKLLERRIVEMEQRQVALTEELKSLQASTPPLDRNSIFQIGQKQFEAGRFRDAITNFNRYLNAPKGQHREEAIWLRGESYRSDQDYKKAIIDYSKILEKYPKSELQPGALLRTGDCFQALGMKDDAKAFWQELISKFPESKEAAVARDNLGLPPLKTKSKKRSRPQSKPKAAKKKK